MRSSRIAAIALLALALFALWAWALQRGNEAGSLPRRADESSHVPNAVIEAQIDELRAELARARSERLSLSSQIQLLRAELDWSAPPENRRGEDTAPAADADLTAAEGSNNREPVQAATAGRFDEAVLLAEGMSAGEVERLREMYESAQMQELYLRDRATREGWVNKPRFQHAIQRVRDAFRETVTDDDFDRVLYAAGKKNRVVLKHILHGSPAQDAGLQDGDVVLSYDDTRVFTPRDLVRATPATTPGELTPIVVLRDGDPIRVFIPGGPIGAQLEPAKVPPPFS